MEFLVILTITTISTLLLRNALRRFPVAFYALAIAAVALYFVGIYGLLPGALWLRALVLLIQRCMVAFSLFIIVMFVGVLPRGSRPDIWLRPVRAQLSIIACILCTGHMCAYLAPYASRALSGSMDATIMVSFSVALVLFVLLIILGITSFNFVKKVMSTQAWKNVQFLAYPFFFLVFVHLLFMLAPSASLGSERAILNTVIYSSIFLIYLGMRLIRYSKDKKIVAAEAKDWQVGPNRMSL